LLDEEGCDFGGFDCWLVGVERRAFMIGKRGVLEYGRSIFLELIMRLGLGSIEDALCA
jgi:hypothetical protein